MKPWQPKGWLLDRLRELVYESLSAPYLVSYAITVKFLFTPDAILRDAMLASWTIAVGRRLGAKWIDGKFQVGNGPPPPAAPVPAG